MMPAAAAILDGMPEPGDLHRVTADGTTWILAGPVPLFSYPEADAGMRNIAVVTLRQLGYPGQAVADLMGLSECYVATLRSRALREGTAGVVRQPGARRKLTGASWERARSWRAAGVADAEIARKLGVAQSTVLRRLGPRDARQEQELPLAEPDPAAGQGHSPQPGLAAAAQAGQGHSPQPGLAAAAQAGPRAQAGPEAAGVPGPEPGHAAGTGLVRAGGAGVAGGRFFSPG